MNNLKHSAGLIKNAGRHGDTVLAHINPQEAAALKAAGGSGTINPETGLPEFSLWTDIRDTFESVAVVVGNYFLPGSSLVTSKLVSKGSQEQLGSTVGRIAAMASGVAGGSAGNLSNYGTILNNLGLSSVTNGISNVSDYLSSTMNSLSGEAVGNAAGNVAGATPAADSVSQVAADSAGIGTKVNPAEWAQGTTGLNVPASEVGKATSQTGGGLISRALDWAGKNPVPALMVGQGVLSTIGGMGTAEATREAAQLNRKTQLEMPAIQRQANMVQGGWETQAPQPADPSEVLTRDGRYVYGPRAGQYAPGRGPGLIRAGV